MKEAKAIKDLIKSSKALAYWSQEFLKANEKVQKCLVSKERKEQKQCVG